MKSIQVTVLFELVGPKRGGYLMLKSTALSHALAATAAGAVFLVASAASATIMTATYTGTVSGYDYYGLFGTPGALSGTFTAVYTYDTSLGSRATSSGSSDEVSGGTGYGNSSPITSSTLTINGVSVPVESDYAGEAYTVNTGGYAGVEEVAELRASNSSGYDYRKMSNSLYNDSAPTSLDQPFSGPSSGAYSGYSGGTFELSMDNYSTGYTQDAYGTLTPDYVTIGMGGAVPEPATWALMLMGFGGLGAVMRSRRKPLGSAASV